MRKCPHCGAELDPLQIRCSKCNRSPSEPPALLSEAQLTQLTKEVRRRLFWPITGGFSLLTLVTGVGLWQIYAEVRDFSQKQIERKFAEPTIKQTFVDVANQRAAQLMTELLQPEIERAKAQSREVADISRDVERARAEFNAELGRFKRATEFSTTSLAAQADDREALDRLRAWSGDDSFEYQRLAGQIVRAVVEQHASPFYRTGFNYRWNRDGQVPTLVEFKQAFASGPELVRVAVLEAVHNQTALAKRDRMAFMIDAMKTDRSLLVVEYAGRYFCTEAELSFKPIETDEIVAWWEGFEAANKK